jgi:CBS domain-containing protein
MAPTAGEIMTADVVTVEASRPLAELEEVFLRHQIHGAPVLDGGRLVGIVSRSDVVRQLKLEEERIAASAFYLEPSDADALRAEDFARVLEAAAHRVATLRVRDLMVEDLVTVVAEASVQEVAQRMAERRIHRVLVTRGEELLGIVTSFDLVRLIAEKGPPA